jgi:hypothetical protein
MCRNKPISTAPWWTTSRKATRFELIGKEKIASTDAYHLKVTLKGGDVREFYLDAVTLLVSKAVVKSVVRGTQVEVESTIGDYRRWRLDVSFFH